MIDVLLWLGQRDIIVDKFHGVGLAIFSGSSLWPMLENGTWRGLSLLQWKCELILTNRFILVAMMYTKWIATTYSNYSYGFYID